MEDGERCTGQPRTIRVPSRLVPSSHGRHVGFAQHCSEARSKAWSQQKPCRAFWLISWPQQVFEHLQSEPILTQESVRRCKPPESWLCDILQATCVPANPAVSWSLDLDLSVYESEALTLVSKLSFCSTFCFSFDDIKDTCKALTLY